MYYFVLNKTVGITQDEQNIRTRSDDNQYVVVVDDFVVFVKMVRRTTARGFIVRQNDEQENKKKRYTEFKQDNRNHNTNKIKSK